MMKHFVMLICLFLSTIGASANRQDKEKGDSIYDRMVELSLLREDEQFKQEKRCSLGLFLRARTVGTLLLCCHIEHVGGGDTDR